MIKINLVVFLLVMQLLLVAVLLAVFALLKVRKLSARLAARRAAPPPPAAAPANDAAHYLATELQRTRGRLEALGGASAAAGGSAAGRLAMRAELLQMEAEWAALTQHDEAAWNRLDARMHVLLAQEGAASASPAATPPVAPPAGQDEVPTKQLFDQQLSTIENLKAAIAEAVSHPETIEALQQQLDKLGGTARELTFCVAILEDENLFLRDQVAALLKHDE